ncbi:MAG TPA: DNA polymerase III subunit alpha [Candidatus Bathyarchaeia archaeon]|nr:DNA polymerase III subunit alpha [Candidatus Bathyarchaeia archaeon]
MGVAGAGKNGAPRADFVHLHVHSEYSLLDGAAQLEKIERVDGQAKKERDVGLIARAAELGFPALALTDHGNLFGAIDFYAACKQAGIKPIIGCELYVAPGSRFERSGQDGGYEGASHATVLVRNEAGYRNLIKLVSKAYLEGFYYKPRVDRELLAQHADGLLVLSGCLNSELSRQLSAGEEAKARETAGWYQEVFGRDHYFMEVQSHGIEEQSRVTEGTVRIARQIGAPLCGTNDSHYVDAAHAKAHETLLCIQTGSTMSDPGRWRFSTEEFYLKSADEMRSVFKDVPEAFRNTLAVAERCDLALSFGQFHLPKYDVPAGYTLDSYLEHLAFEGLKRRYGSSPADAVVERLRYELSIVTKMGFSGYFLVVWDFIAFARRQGIAVGPGRGSSAGSLVAYCLGITNVDPVGYGLLFERFLNPERISMPDMDIDFADDRRDEVIRYVADRYGADRVAHIITFGTMGAKAVIRDVARVMGFSFGEADRIAKLVPGFPLNITLDDALEKSPQLAEQVKRDPRVGELWGVARALEGCTRHASVHASAVVISDEPLMERVPLYKDPKRPELITGFAMGPIEKLGLLKMDFLGLRTLTVIADAARLVKESKGIELDPEALPLDDPKVYQLLSEARTFGVFQLESAGMRDALRSLEPTRIQDIIAMVALYRPGPMELIPEFVNRKHGRAPITYEHPLMERHLQETYGIMIYQEQVMGLAAELAGFSLGEADTLRKAMGKKDRELMAAQKAKFLVGCRANQVDGKKAEKIWDLIEKFAGYGFNKSHAACYGLVAYQTAYFKANHPVEFMAALLTSEMEKTDKIVQYMEECRSMGLRVEAPDVAVSGARFTVTGPVIHFGLAAIKNVGGAAIESIVKARGEGGAFLSLTDFCSRVDLRLVNRRVVESLIKAGALDSLGSTRAGLLSGLDQAMEAGQRSQRDREEGQGSLFESLAGPSAAPAAPVRDSSAQVPEWSREELLAGEKEVLGFYLSGHPLDEYRDLAQRLKTASAAELAARSTASQVRLLGLVSGLTENATKSGNRMAFATLELVDGSVPLTVFPEPYRACSVALRHRGPVLIRGRIDDSDKGRVVLVEEVKPLDEATVAAVRTAPNGSASSGNGGGGSGREATAHTCRVRLRPGPDGVDQMLAAVRQICEAHPGATPLFVHVLLAEQEVVVRAKGFAVEPAAELVAKVEALLGPGSILVEYAGRS